MTAAGSMSGALSHCQALIVAHGKQHTNMMLRLCQSVGFGKACQLSDFAFDRIDQHTVHYVLMHYDMGDAAKRKLIGALRGVGNAEICFAPIILLLPDIPYDEVLNYIEMGFDDVVCLPEKNDVLHGRLEKQLYNEHVYIKTEAYFGPDRRRMEVAGTTHAQRAGTSEFTKIVIRRTPGEGVTVISSQLFIRGTPVPSGTVR